MELAIDDPIKRAQQYAVNQNQFQAPQAPLSQNPGVGTQMANMAKNRAMEGALNAGQKGITEGITSALAPSAGATKAAALASNPATMGMGGAEVALAGQTLAPTAGAGMAALGTAMPYVGAGLLAGKVLGLFNEGGMVGPLSTQYHAEGGKPMNTPEMKKLLEGLTLDELYKEKYGDASIKNFIKQHTGTQYKAQGGMTQDQAMALMNNQPDPDQLYNEIVAESMIGKTQQGQVIPFTPKSMPTVNQMPQYQTMPPTMPLVGPLSVDSMGADTTYDAEMYKPINT